MGADNTCNFGLTAVILSPSVAKIQIHQCETVQFEAIAVGGLPYSSSTDGTDGQYGYYWDTAGNTADSYTAAAMEVTFNTPGTFTIFLTVKDRSESKDTAKVTVTVIPDPANCEPPDETNEEDTATGGETDTDTGAAGATDGQNSTPLDAKITDPGTDTITLYKYRSYTFQGSGSGGEPYADGEPYNYLWSTAGNTPASSTAKTVDVEFNTVGVFTITFQVTDLRGVTDTDTVTVTVPALKAEITDSPPATDKLTPGGVYTFKGEGTGGTGSYTYSWDTAGHSYTATDPEESEIEITFDNGTGTFDIIFKVEDSEGETDVDLVEVTVFKLYVTDP
jgi:hypothetical protein